MIIIWSEKKKFLITERYKEIKTGAQFLNRTVRKWTNHRNKSSIIQTKNTFPNKNRNIKSPGVNLSFLVSLLVSQSQRSEVEEAKNWNLNWHTNKTASIDL